MKNMYKITIQKVVALLLLITLIFSLFSPYASFGYYQDENGQDKYNLLRVSEITKGSSGNYMFYVEYLMINDVYAGSFDISLSYDTDLFASANKNTGAASTKAAQIMDKSGNFTFQIATFSNGSINMTGTTTDWWNPAEDDGEGYDDIYGDTISVFKLYFYLKDPSKWKKDGTPEITTDMISWKPLASLRTGYKQRIADDYDGTKPRYIQDLEYVAYDGFAKEESNSEITSIEIITDPTKMKYADGESLNFEGGKVKITYGDDPNNPTVEELTIEDAISSGKITASATVADSTKTVTFTGGSASADLKYYVLDSIRLKTNITKTDYEHDDTIDFAGGVIEAKYLNVDGNSTTEDIDIVSGIASGEVKVDRTKADVKNSVVAATYKGKTVDIPLTVTDPIDSIVITTMPDTLEYDHDATINPSGGIIKAIKRSKEEITNISMSSSDVTISPNKADINACTSTWQNGSLTAGKQTITVEYEGKTTTYPITVNDTIDSIAVKTQPTAKNKYGTNSGNLDYTDAKITVTTSSGNTFDTAVTAGMVDTTSYNANTLLLQNLPVNYAGKTTANGKGINITLLDYINGITVTAPNDLSVNYNNNIDLSNVTYVKNYASGTTSTSLPVTSSMISGFNKTPSASDFDSNHEYVEPITVKLTTADDGDIDEIPQTDTFNVTVKDILTGITIATKPARTTFSYGEGFTAQNGKIQELYASGATGANISMTNPNVSVTELDGTSSVSTSPMASEFTNGICKKNVLVTYKGCTAQYEIKIEDTVKSISIDTDPTKEFNHGDNFSTGNGTLKVTYSSGRTGTVPMSDSNVTITQTDSSAINMSPNASDYNSEHKYTESLLVEYNGAQATYDITIINDIKSIAMHTTPKTQYNVNDNLDLTTDGTNYGEIEVTRAVGTAEIVALNDSRVTVTGFDSTVEHANLLLAVKFEENGISKNTSYAVSVVDSVTSITMKDTPKQNYKYNESLDVTGGKITVTKGSGSQDIPITASMVTEMDGTPFDPTNLGTRNLKVTYGGKETTYEITVKDYVTGITVNPDTVTGTYNDELADVINDNNITYTVTYAKGGAQTAEPLTADMVSGYSKTSINEQNLTVTYTDNDTNSATKGDPFTANLKVTLSDGVGSIAITAPSKTTYNHGDALDLTGGTITVTSSSGAVKTVPMTTAMITEGGASVNMSPTAADFGNSTTLNKTLTITYSEGGKTETINYPITIVNDVRSIAMHTTPKTQYNVNDNLDLTTDGTNYGEIEVTRAVGTAEIVALNDSRVTVTGFDSTVEHANLLLAVKFEENGISKNTSYAVSVVDSVTSITMKDTPKQNYKYNESLDVTGGKITVTKGSGSQDIPITASMVTEMDGTPFDPTNLGTRNLKVTYGGKETTYEITVKDYVTGITVNPDTVTGTYNDELADVINDNNITYTVTYAKGGAQTAEPLTADMVSGYSKTSINEQNLTVTYTDNDTNSATKGDPFTATLKVKLVDEIVGMVISKNPDNTEYGYGDPLDTTGGIITITTKSGKTNNIGFNEKGVTLTETDGSPLDLTNVTFDENHKATKTIQVNYEGKKATFEIEITNKITGIVMENTPKTNYSVNDSLDLTTDGTTVGTIKVTRQNNETESIKLDNANVKVTGFDNTQENQKLELTVSYTENSITKTTNYTVSVTDNVLDVEIENTPKTQYKYGESLDVSTGTLKVTRSSGTVSIPMKPEMITEADGSAFNGKKLGTRDLTVTYGGKTLTYEVTVSDYVKGIMLTPPTKVNYEYGESLDLTGGSVQKVMASGATTTAVALSDSSVTLSTFDPHKEGTQSIKVTYEGFTESFGVKVEDSIQSISIISKPKTEYKYGESLNVTGGKILVTKTSGKTETVNITTSMVTKYNPNQLGEQTLVVTYKGKTATYDVNVKDWIKDISLVRPQKLVYKIGESIDLTGGKVNAVMASGTATSPVAMTDASVKVTGFDSTSEGAKLIKVTYEGFTKTFGITVVDELSGMVIMTLPDKLDYRYGEELDVTGGTIEIEKESGAKEVIPMTKSMVSGYNAHKLGPQTLTVTYQGFTQQFIVNVEDYVSELKVQTPSKVEYEYGEYLDVTGGKVSIVMASGKIDETVDMTASMVSGFERTKEGKQTIKVEYKGLQGSFQVNVVDKIKGISLNSEPNKTTYQYSENIDLTGATIKVIKSSGIEIVTVTPNMISGYHANNPGKQLITVTYGGYTTSFIVFVKEPEKVTQTTNTTNTTTNTARRNNTNSKTTEGVNTETVKEVVEASETVEEQNDKPIETTPTQKTQPEEKPTKTLGIKDEKEDEPQGNKGLVGGIGIAGTLILLLFIATRRNVKIYVEEEGEFVLGGTDKIGSKHLTLDLDKYLDEETYEGKVKIVLNKAISKKLDGKELKIIHREKMIKHTINYNDEPYEIILK